jgi:hypothetical protein
MSVVTGLGSNGLELVHDRRLARELGVDDDDAEIDQEHADSPAALSE